MKKEKYFSSFLDLSGEYYLSSCIVLNKWLKFWSIYFRVLPKESLCCTVWMQWPISLCQIGLLLAKNIPGTILHLSTPLLSLWTLPLILPFWFSQKCEGKIPNLVVLRNILGMYCFQVKYYAPLPPPPPFIQDFLWLAYAQPVELHP